jgi:hypothetical protein
MRSRELPPGALLNEYRGGGAYTDAYFTEVPGAVSHSEYVEAFYTTPVFKLERLLLRWLVSKPSTDVQARQLALGTLSAFAAWNVERRAADQVLLSDFTGRTKSWLMVVAVENSGAQLSTRLYFGSAVIPVIHKKSGRPTLGFTFRSLLGFHKIYSRVLLHAARLRLAGS